MNTIGPITLAAPGTPDGPCIGKHRDRTCQGDCEATMAAAAFVCEGCRRPVGYERAFVIIGRETVLHVACQAAAQAN